MLHADFDSDVKMLCGLKYGELFDDLSPVCACDTCEKKRRCMIEWTTGRLQALHRIARTRHSAILFIIYKGGKR